MVNANWWTGVVEDRNDPEKLGRCRVRIFGYHTEDKNLLPTQDLPWAVPIQPITSAANSGVGSSPLGVVEGSWVVGFFLDGDECQQPALMGTIAGKPKLLKETEEKLQQIEEQKFYLRDSFGNIVYDENGKPKPKTSSTLDIRENLFPFNRENVNSFLNVMQNRLSESDPSKVGANNELGKYQIDVFSLVNLGYLKRPPEGIVDFNIVDSKDSWTGKNNLDSKDTFLKNASAQDEVMLELMKRNHDILTITGKINSNTSRPVLAGLLATAHLGGVVNADKLDKKDANGKKLRDVYSALNLEFGGREFTYSADITEDQNYLPSIEDDVFKNLNNEELSKIRGFRDPNKKYPKYEYAGLSDVNKLAIGDTSHLSIRNKEKNRITNIELARTKQTWDEPENAYAASYPFNQVIETEAGHVVEFDNTPNAERIHVYHKKGTYIEIDVNGSMVRKVVGDNYEVIDRNNFIFVKGASSVTVEGKTSILVKDDAVIQVDGDLSVTGHGDTLVQSAKNIAVVSKTAVVTTKDSLDIVTDGILKLQAKDIIMHAKGGDLALKSDKDLSLQSGRANNISIKGGLSVSTDAAILRNKMGATTIGPLGLKSLTPPQEKTPDKTPISVLQRTVAREEYFLFDSGEDGAEEYRENLLEKGKISDLIVSASNESRIFGRSQTIPIQSEATEIDQFTTFPRSFKLSKYYTIGDLLVGNRGVALVAQGGLTEKQIVENMKNLAVNCLDPIREKYKDVIITSGFRAPFVGSDHNTGSAADLMFTKTSFSKYIDIAEWIAQNVPYRQLLLEYRFNGTDIKPAATWIHISLLIQNGKIIPSTKMQLGTFKNHAAFSRNKFINLA